MRTSISLLLVATALLPWAVQAHAHLDKAIPANGSVVATAPTTVSLTFNEAATLTALSVQRAGDKAVQKLGPLPKVPNDHFTVALPKLTPGDYTVKYRVLSDDNHVMGGTTTFTISAGTKGMSMKGGGKKDMNMNGMDMKSQDMTKTTPAPASSVK